MLGLRRGTVHLVPHDTRWAELFRIEKQLIEETFGSAILAIEHVGSTAIPRIPAKPILDIMIGVRSLLIAGVMKQQFAQIGYEHRPFQLGDTLEDLVEQELYVKGLESSRTHHAHVTVHGGDWWKTHIFFRDYLIGNPGVARRYGEIKLHLAQQHRSDRAAYTRAKTQFVLDVLAKTNGNE